MTKGTQEEQDLAFDLVKYAYHSTGFEYTPFSFVQQIPTTFWTDDFGRTRADRGLVDSTGRTYNEYLQTADDYIRNTPLYVNPQSITEKFSEKGGGTIANSFIHQFLRNNFDREGLVKTVTRKSKGAVYIKGIGNKPGYVVIKAGRFSTFTSLECGLVTYVNRYNTNLKKNELFIFSHVMEGHGIYNRVEPVGSTNFLKIYNANGVIEGDWLERNKKTKAGKVLHPGFNREKSSFKANIDALQNQAENTAQVNPLINQQKKEDVSGGALQKLSDRNNLNEVRYDSLGNELELAGVEIVRKEDGSTYNEFNTVKEAKAAFEKLSLQQTGQPAAEVTAIQQDSGVELQEKDLNFKKGELETFTLFNGTEVKGTSIIIENQPNVDLFTYRKKGYGWAVIDNKSKKQFPLSEFFNGGSSTKNEILDALHRDIVKYSKNRKGNSIKALESIGFNFNKPTQQASEVGQSDIDSLLSKEKTIKIGRYTPSARFSDRVSGENVNLEVEDALSAIVSFTKGPINKKQISELNEVLDLFSPVLSIEKIDSLIYKYENEVANFTKILEGLNRIKQNKQSKPAQQTSGPAAGGLASLASESKAEITQNELDKINENIKKAGFSGIYSMEKFKNLSLENQLKVRECYG